MLKAVSELDLLQLAAIGEKKKTTEVTKVQLDDEMCVSYAHCLSIEP